MHDQLQYEIKQAELRLEQERIDSQKFCHQREYELNRQFQEKQHEDELEAMEACKGLLPPKETFKAKTPRILAFNEDSDEMDSYLLRFERYATA